VAGSVVRRSAVHICFTRTTTVEPGCLADEPDFADAMLFEGFTDVDAETPLCAITDPEEGFADDAGTGALDVDTLFEGFTEVDAETPLFRVLKAELAEICVEVEDFPGPEFKLEVMREDDGFFGVV
jgi:hypothetical protein